MINSPIKQLTTLPVLGSISSQNSVGNHLVKRPQEILVIHLLLALFLLVLCSVDAGVSF